MFVSINLSLTVKAATLIFQLLNNGNQVLFTIWRRINKLLCVHFMKIQNVYTLNSHLLTLKAHDHKFMFLSSTKISEAS